MLPHTYLIKSKVESLGDYPDTSCSRRNLNKITEGQVGGSMFSPYASGGRWPLVNKAEQHEELILQCILWPDLDLLLFSLLEKRIHEELIQSHSYVNLRSGCYLCTFERGKVPAQPVNVLSP